MKIQIIDGEVTEVSQQDWQAFEAWRKEQAKDWPQKGEQYFAILRDGQVVNYIWFTDIVDTRCQSIGNIYRTQAEALAQVEKLKAKARIDKYIAANGLAFVPDWDNEEGYSTIGYRLGRFEHYSWKESKVEASFYFESNFHAKQVIDNCTDDLKTIFGVK